MDNVNDWLYIVFLIIAGVSGLISSGKKKKHSKEVLGHPENDVPVETNTPQAKGFWEILQEMQTEKPVPEPILVKDKIQKKQKQERKRPSPFLSGESDFANRQTVVPASAPIILEEEGSTTEEHTFTDMEEIRKAIIYSEILTRKY